MSQYDTEGLYQFLKSTPERGLRGMLIDAQFTEVHLNMLLKVVRAGDAEQFGRHFEQKAFPRVRFNDKENKIQPKFWDDCEKCLNARGLLSPALPKKVEKIAA